MRPPHRIAQVLILALTVCPWGQAESATSEPDAREQARQALNGREAVVRFYADWKEDPKSYATLAVPLHGIDVTFDAIAQAAARAVPEDAAVVVVPGDQRDPNIAGAMNGCLFGERYRPGGRVTLWPGYILPIQLAPCLFRDALREPIRNAEVQILLSDCPMHDAARAKVWIADAKLDENGRMAPPRASVSCSFRYVLFTVMHPDCGPTPANSFHSNPQKEHEISVPALPRDKWCVFVDALGQPMAGATVEVVPHSIWAQGRGKSRPSVVLDEAGRLRPFSMNATFELCCFLVHDPNYGIGIVEPWRPPYYRNEKPSPCVVPLVAAGTRADERSIWGVVVDANDKPVPEAVLECQWVRTPGGGSLVIWSGHQSMQYKPAKVLTDAQGRFAMHLPLPKDDGTLGRPVPPGALYEVSIDHRDAAWDYQPFREFLTAGQEHKIVLRPKSQAFRGFFVFQDERGPVSDVEKLKRVTLSVRTPMPTGGFRGRTFASGSWMEAQELTPGSYSATAEWDGKIYVFGPVEVTGESPETLVLSPTQIKPARVLCSGRVVHGITGEPIAGALVMRQPSVGLLNAIEDDLFTQLHYLGPELDPDGHLVRLLASHPELGITRTDASGRFEIAVPGLSPDRPFERLLAIQMDFLGAEQQLGIPQPGIDEKGRPRLREFEPDATGKIVLPDMTLFPAGTVLVEPSVPVQNGPMAVKDVGFRYATARGDPTPWLKDLWASPVANQGGSVFRKQKLPVNEPQIVYVPADVTLTLTLALRGNDGQSTPAVIRNVRLRQGEVLNLGRVEFPTGVQVAVRAIDSKGAPLEGITIKTLSEGIDYGGRGVVTDGRGSARIAVPPDSKGRFYVEYFSRETATLVREDTPYEVGGQEDAGREFVLQLSDGFLEQLLKAP